VPMSGVDTETLNGQTTNQPNHDCYGSQSVAFGTNMTRLIPPKSGMHSCVGTQRYEAAGTAHNMTVMPAIKELYVTEDQAAAGTTLKLNDAPTDYNGGAAASGDWISVQHQDGSYGEYKVSSISALTITITALTKAVKAGARFFFHGTPGSAGDHSASNFTMKASTITELVAGDFRNTNGTGGKDKPILIVVDNATATGTWYKCAYFYDPGVV